MRIAGLLAPAALEAALASVVDRHEALRTTFPAPNGVPVQVVAPQLAVPVPVTTVAGATSDERTARCRILVEREVRRSFDLARGPLVRAALYQCEPDDHVLVLVLHHIACDGWSVGVLVRELTAAYRGDPPPPPLPLQYPDYAVWQRDWLSGEVLRRQLDYWTRTLAGAPDALPLPTDRPRPPVPSARGGVETAHWPRELATDLDAIGRRLGVTLFMTLLAGFQVVLFRYSGRADLARSGPRSPTATWPETEGLIGHFVNMLAAADSRADAALPFRRWSPASARPPSGRTPTRTCRSTAWWRNSAPRRDLGRTPSCSRSHSSCRTPRSRPRTARG